jgi:Mandelate racemase / muconate lactonizing enzyme, N-terminal domain
VSADALGDTAVREVAVSAFTVPTDAPEADGTIPWGATTLVVVEPVAEECTGLGWSYTSPAAVPLIKDVLVDCAVGTNPLDVPGVNETMRRRVRNTGYRGLAATAISAVDIGLWDLKAKLLGLSLAASVRDGSCGLPPAGRHALRRRDGMAARGGGRGRPLSARVAHCAPNLHSRSPAPPRCCGTWSTSTTTPASRICSSTAHWTRPAAPSPPPRTGPGWDCSCVVRTRSSTASHERRRPGRSSQTDRQKDQERRFHRARAPPAAAAKAPPTAPWC